MENELNDLLWVLPMHRDHAKRRALLCDELHCTDSHLRKLIRSAREQGYMICANTETGGYYLGDTDADYKMLHASYYKRVKSLVRTMKKLDERYGQGLQIDLADLLGGCDE